MNDHTQQYWSYPGSRWWKFDFHTHTPVSTDTYWAKKNISLTPEQWLQHYMDAEIDCIAVTDHNSGAWIDNLKSAYAEMQETNVPGFRELYIFPGVEISVNGGFHLLAVFDVDNATSDIDTLIGNVEFNGTKGGSDAVTEKSAVQVVEAILDAGGIPIPAHTDSEKGLLRLKNNDSEQASLDAKTLQQILSCQDILAMEVVDRSSLKPALYKEAKLAWSEVLGSDCHNFQSKNCPGSRYTWVKMASPTLEGLRLALLDGNDISIRRSDEDDFAPFQIPEHFINRIEIVSARFMGNGTTERIDLTPYYNALIGGRGTGKSTIVHALRLGYRRNNELQRLGDTTEPFLQFNRFSETAKGRESVGGLRENTEIRIELIRDGVAHRLRWRQDGKRTAVEERDSEGGWRESASQAINTERFPIRLFSQGQIAAMAGESRQALVDVIDEAANVGKLNRDFKELKATYFSQRARLRELDGLLDVQPELNRQLTDLNRKVEALANSDHAEVLKAHQLALRQRREINTTLDQLQAMPTRIHDLAQELIVDDWPDGVFDTTLDESLLAWRAEAERTLDEVREALRQAAEKLIAKVPELNSDPRLTEWRQRADHAGATYGALQVTLQEQGVTDPQAFEHLIQERQQLEKQLKRIDQLRLEKERLEANIAVQWNKLFAARLDITRVRSEFVKNSLTTNKFVQIEVVKFGFNAHNIERNLRDLLDERNNHFEKDILDSQDGNPTGGLAYDLASADDREAELQNIKQQIITVDSGFDGRFRNNLQRKLARPEFADHVQCWFPEDDLHIKYSREGNGQDWIPITQASQGQLSAALLAFLLAFGDEPLVLDQPEDDLDNHLIYNLIVRQIRENKLRRQLIIVTHNPNVVVNGDAEMVHAFTFSGGQCHVAERGALQEQSVRLEVCDVMEGGHEAFAQRWARLGREV